MITEDTNLLDACNRLDHAAGRLFGPQTAQHDGRMVTAPSLWQQLELERYSHGGKGRAGTTTMKSTPAAKLHLLDLADEIETGIRGWASDPDAPLTELVDWLSTPQAWSPHDAGHVLALTAQLDAWRERVHDELTGGSRLEVRAACPECGRTHFYEPDGIGGQKRRPALTVTTVQARCAVCGTTWSPQYYGLLLAVIEQQDGDQ